MGLPLFVAPVEPDVSKLKNRATSSPSHTNIRRSYSSFLGTSNRQRRERPDAQRRARLIAEIERTADTQRNTLEAYITSEAGRRDERLLRNLELTAATGYQRNYLGAGANAASDIHRRSRLLAGMDDAADTPRRNLIDASITSDYTSADITAAADYIRRGFQTREDVIDAVPEREERRMRLLEVMNERFGRGWRMRDWQHPQQDLDLGWWMVEPQLWGGRARITRLDHDRLGVHPTHPNSIHLDLPESPVNRPSAISALNRIWGAREPITARAPTGARRQVNDDINGLGDRNRSVSPEEWNTLFSTLTPDPQPPSASSSFVSNVASQNAAASSRTTRNHPLEDERPLIVLPPVESLFESGCDNSDTEEDDSARPPPVAPGMLRRNRIMAVRFGIMSPQHNQEAEDTRTRGRWRDARRNRARARVLAASRMMTPEHEAVSTTTRHQRRLIVARNQEVEATTRPSNFPWTGRLEVGADDEAGADSRREEAVTGPENLASGEEDLAGLLRITQGMADSREDIPDELWVEAGLGGRLSEYHDYYGFPHRNGEQ